MTERFTYFKSKIGFGKQGIDDNLKGYTFDFTLDNVLDCMNELAEENEQLKEAVWSWSKSYNRVYEDNERILNTIKYAYYNERTQLGKSVLKQLLEAIQ